MLNAGNKQAIQSGVYLFHEIFFEINSNIFGPPTVHNSIEHKKVVKLLTVHDIRCLFISARFLFFTREKINMLTESCCIKSNTIFRACTPVDRQELSVLIFLIFG